MGVCEWAVGMWECVGGGYESPPPPQGASLGTMVGWMTYGWKKFESVDSIMRQSISPLYQAMQGLLPLVDADSAAFGQFQVLYALFVCTLLHYSIVCALQYV